MVAFQRSCKDASFLCAGLDRHPTKNDEDDDDADHKTGLSSPAVPRSIVSQVVSILLP
jgi:hypothetical protein